MTPDVVLTIDPGLMGTGVVVWDANDWNNDIQNMRFSSKLFTSREKEWSLAARDIALQIVKWLKPSNVIMMYVEFPQNFQSALGQSISNRGDLFKLVFLIGCIRGAFMDSTFLPVSVPEWKGQLPKAEVERRCKRVIPEKQWVESNHVWDAVGIGLYLRDKI